MFELYLEKLATVFLTAFNTVSDMKSLQ